MIRFTKKDGKTLVAIRTNIKRIPDAFKVAKRIAQEKGIKEGLQVRYDSKTALADIPEEIREEANKAQLRDRSQVQLKAAAA